jgi:hypothetical protein
MTAINRTPQNTNLLQPTKFILTFDRLPTVQFFCQAANIPGVNLGQAPLNTPMLDVYAPGNKMIYNPFNINFLVNEDMSNWQEIHAWFCSIASPESFTERKRLSDKQNINKTGTLSNYSDATLTVMSALNNPILRVQFINCFPITLSDVVFDSKQSADDIITADAVFVFDYFNFLPLNS